MKPEEQAQVDAVRLAEIEMAMPDLMVKTDDMGAPMRLADFLAAAKAEADAMRADAPDFETAALCALTNGAIR